MEVEPRVEEIDFSLNLLRETIVDEYTIVPKTWILEVIDKLLDRRFEITNVES